MPRKDPVATPTADDLHASADALRQSTDPNDCGAKAYAAAASAMLNGQPVTFRRAANWLSALQRYEDHWRRHGHAPRENTRARHTLTAEERRLGEWGRYQRRFEEQLNAYQRARLDVSPAFEWDPLGRLWRKSFAACVRFLNERGTLPRLNSSDLIEFRLARWLGRQLRRLQSGALDQTHAQDLNRLLRRPSEVGREPRREPRKGAPSG